MLTGQASLTLLGLVIGAIAWLAHAERVMELAWLGATWVTLVPSTYRTGRALLRRELHVDAIAIVSMAGALLLRQYLAGAVIAAMLAGGTALERFATARARRELSALLQRAPRTAHLRRGEAVEEVDISAVGLGDTVLVRRGEVVPVDGILVSGSAVIDESALTGESRPVPIARGERIRSGVLNGGTSLELKATATAAESTYAGVIRLVRQAETSKATVVRMADRYALAFLVLTFSVAGAAWLLAGPLRALAVVVVATPCPLILAVPAAIIAAVSYAARHGVIIKGGRPLEALARATVLLLDKTGTITRGRAKLVSIETSSAVETGELLAAAASLEQLSTHPFAPAILRAARDRRLELAFPSEVHEEPGVGIRGLVNGRPVSVGQARWVAPALRGNELIHRVVTRAKVEGSAAVFVAIGGTLAGALLLEDPIRAEAPRALDSLRSLGIRRIHMVTGDHPDVAELVGDAVGTDEVFSERTPEEKVATVQALLAQGQVIMAGDGINDAPALALATVGVAMGARGATAASEAADVVLTRDNLGSLVLAVRIARRARRIALQSALGGMGLSLAGMLAALGGLLAPVAGALVQEGIDLLVILNALRALGGGGLVQRTTPGLESLSKALGSRHRELLPEVDALSVTASRLDALGPADALEALRQSDEFLSTRLLPHEREEQRTAFPALGTLLPGENPAPGLVRTHREIARLVRLHHRLLEQLPPSGPGPADIQDFQRVLYGLHAILELHFAQEDELYSLMGEPSAVM